LFFSVLPALAVGGVVYALAGGVTLGSPEAAPSPRETSISVAAPVVSAPAVAVGAAPVGVPQASFAPEPSPEPAAPPAGAAPKPRATAQAPAPTLTDAAPTLTDAASWCASKPGASAGATADASSLMAAANVERARLGYAALSWSGDLAAAATGWSQAMAAADDTTEKIGDALAHNPNRPAGGENVAMNYSSAGRDGGTAASIAHSGWMGSTGHCENIMNPRWTTMGAGGAQAATGAWYFTENFQ